ncbi:hypothetical protein [Vibrio phage vB_pir03]|nr:hypothetical protein [Vibrio phage vB_pir03]
MNADNISKAVALGNNFSSRALVLANARRIGVHEGTRIENRRVDTSGDLAVALLLLDASAYHISTTFRQHTIALDKSHDANKKAKATMDTIRNGICRFTSETFAFFYPEHDHLFTSVSNPWLTEGIKTARAIALLLPMAIARLASVAYRRRGSWEEKIIAPILDDLVWLANVLVRGLPGGKVTEGTFHVDKIETFHDMFVGYVGEGTQPNNMPAKPVANISPDVSLYLGTKLNSFKWHASHLKEGGSVVIPRHSIMRFGSRAYMATKLLELKPDYQLQSGDFNIL